jgi:hypothetical protein
MDGWFFLSFGLLTDHVEDLDAIGLAFERLGTGVIDCVSRMLIYRDPFSAASSVCCCASQ